MSRRSPAAYTKTLVPVLLIVFIGLWGRPAFERVVNQQSTTADSQALHYKSIDLIRNIDKLINVDSLGYSITLEPELPTPTPSATPTELPCLDKCARTPLCYKWCAEIHQL